MKRLIFFIVLIFLHFNVTSNLLAQCSPCTPGGAIHFGSDIIISSNACYTGASMDNHTLVTIQSGVTLTICGDWTGQNGDGITVNSGGTLIITGKLDLANTFQLISNGSVSIGSVELDNGSTMQVQGSGTLAVTGNVTTGNSSAITVAAGGDLSVGGSLSAGSGATITVSGTLDVEGSLTVTSGTITATGTIEAASITGATTPLSAIRYRSVATGNWNATSSWQSSTDGTTWSAATATPTSDNNTITIRNGHTISMNISALSVDQLTIESGGVLNYSGISRALTIVNGTGEDFTINSGGTFTQNSGGTYTLTISSGANVIVNGLYNRAVSSDITTTGTLIFGATGYYNQTVDATIPTASWNSSSTCKLSGYSITTVPGGLSQTFGRLRLGVTYSNDIDFSGVNLNCQDLYISGMTSSGNDMEIGRSSTVTMNVTDSLNVDITGSLILAKNNGNFTMNIGTLILNSGTINCFDAGQTATSTVDINISGDFIVTGGTFNGGNQASSYANTYTCDIGGNVTISGGTVYFHKASYNSTTNIIADLTLSTGSVYLNNSSGTATFNVNDVTINSGTFYVGSSTGTTNFRPTGNLDINSGTFDIASSTGTSTITVTGNVTVDGGNYTLSSGTANTTSTINIDGNFTSSGTPSNGVAYYLAGIFSGHRITYNIKGSIDWSTGPMFTSGNAGNTSAAIATINLTGTGSNDIKLPTGLTYRGGAYWNWTISSGRTVTLQSDIELGGSTANACSFINNGTLIMGTNIIKDVTSATTPTFTNSSGATLKTAHTQGISTSASTGSVQVTGTKTYNTGGHYEYNGVVAQVTGNGLPSSPSTISGSLVINNTQAINASNTGVSLSQATTISGTLTLSAGVVTTTSTNSLTLSSTGSISGGAASSYVNGPFSIARTSLVLTPYPTFHVGKGGRYLPVTINSITSTTDPKITIEAYSTDVAGTISSTDFCYLSTTEYWDMIYSSSTTTNPNSIVVTVQRPEALGDLNILTSTSAVTSGSAYNTAYVSRGGASIATYSLKNSTSLPATTQSGSKLRFAFGSTKSKPGTATATLSSVCSGSNTTISVSGYSVGATIQWQESDDNGASDAWSTAVGGSNGTSATYTTANITSAKYYRAAITGGPSGCSGTSYSTVASVTISSGADTYYVATTGSDSNNGTTSGTPFLTLQKAIDMVSCSSTTIHIAAGTYIQDDITINNKSNITIIGAGISSTIFDGDFGNRFMAISGTSSNISISNMKIMEMDELSVHTTYSGGGLYITASGTVNVTSVYFYKCKCSTSGGSGGGGAIYIGSSSTVNIYKSKFTNNENARANGSQDGASICNNGNVLIENCLFHDNLRCQDNQYDGDIAFKNSGSGEIVNSTIKYSNNCNVPLYMDNTSSVTILNSILYGSHGGYDIVDQSSGTITSVNCIGYTGNVWGNTKTNCTTTTDFGFTNSAGGNYSITGSSPCLNYGTSSISSPISLTAPSDDFDGTTRSGNPDVGCYEVISASTITLASNTVTAANNCTSSLKVPIQSFSLAVTVGTGNLTNVSFTTSGGTYAQSDVTNFKIWYGGTTNDLSLVASPLATLTPTGGNGTTETFTAFSSPTLSSGSTYYFWITADIASGVTNDHTIAVDAITTFNLTTTSNTAGTTSAGGTQTLKATPTPADAGANQTSPVICGISEVTLAGNNPTIGSGTWTIQSGSLGSLTSASTYNTTFNGKLGQTYVLRWTISNASCASSTDEVTISFIAPKNTIPATGDYVWKGNTNTWSTLGNWLYYDGTKYTVAGSTPTSSNRIIISAINNCASAHPTLAADICVGSLIIEAGATLNQSTYTTTINGDFTNNGTFNAGTGTTSFTSAATITGATTFHNLIANAALTFASSHVVNNSLTLGNKIILGANNLTIGSSGSITGYSASNYIVTNSTGKLKRSDIGVGGATGQIIFPVGIASSYTPITLENIGTIDDFSVRVAANRLANGTSGGASIMHAVDRTWFVEEAIPSGSNIEMTIQWNAGEELAPTQANAFNRLNCFISHYTNGAWDRQTGSAASGSGPYTISRSGITSFSPFSVEDPQALPITLIDFTAKAEGKKVRLDWETGSEENNDYFTIERSLDGKTFEKVFTKDGAGVSKTNLYYFGYDASPYTGVSYYRLKQTDFDGKFAYSDIVSAKVVGEQMDTEIDVNVYPNPVTSQLIHIDLKAKNNATYIIRIINEIGQQIFTDNYDVIAGNNYYEVHLPNVVAGVYVLEIKNNENGFLNNFKIAVK